MREFIARISPATWLLVARAQQRAAPVFLAVVCIVLLINGLIEIGFAYQQHKASLIRIQREQAEAAAAKIGQFIKVIESRVGWRPGASPRCAGAHRRRHGGAGAPSRGPESG